MAGLLEPRNLLDVLRHFTLFMNVNGYTVRAVCRYQQYRAVSRAIDRLRSARPVFRMASITGVATSSGTPKGRARACMVFVIRKLRTDPQLRRFKVMAVTDRTDLEQQLSLTAALTG